MFNKSLLRFYENDLVNRLSDSFPSSKRSSIILKNMAAELSDVQIRVLLVKVIVGNSLNGLTIMRNIFKHDEYFKDVELPSKVFEWSMVHFKRRMAPNINCINILRLEHPETVTLSKLMTDLNNIEDILRQFSAGQVDQALITLMGCKKMLNIRKDLEHQYEANKAIMVELLNNDINFARMERQRSIFNTEKLFNTVDRCRDEELVSEPIYHRHIINEQNKHFDMLKYKLEKQENCLRQQVEELKENMATNATIKGHVMHFFSYQIDTFRNQIVYWQWRYDEEFEKLDNEINYKQLSIRAIQLQWEEYKDRIEFYHSEMRRVQDNMIRASEIAERARLEAIEAALNKPKKKGKGKKEKK